MQPHSLVRIIITGCWVVFVATWAFAAVSTKRTVYRETQAQRLRYWVLLVIAFFLLFYGRLPYPLNSRYIGNDARIERVRQSSIEEKEKSDHQQYPVTQPLRLGFTIHCALGRYCSDGPGR